VPVQQIAADPNPARRRRRLWGENIQSTLAANAKLNRTPATPKQLHLAIEEALAGEGRTISKQAVYGWLAGNTAPNVENQALLARILGVPHHMLFQIEVPT
jgi:hypothetical protein